MVGDDHGSPDHPDHSGGAPYDDRAQAARHDPTEMRDADGVDARDGDDADIRSLLAGLRDPAVSRENLADRLRLSLTQPQHRERGRRPLPPVEPNTHSRLSRRAMVTLVGSIAAAALIGAVTLSVMGLPDTPVDEVFAADALRRAGVSVTVSGTSYRTDSLAEQALPLVNDPVRAGDADERPGARRSAIGEQAQHFVAVGAATGSASAHVGSDDTTQMESKVLSCLRHLRIHTRDIVAVDLAHLDGRSAAVVVTVDRAGHRDVRAIDPACPVLGSAVLAGPQALPAQP